MTKTAPTATKILTALANDRLNKGISQSEFSKPERSALRRMAKKGIVARDGDMTWFLTEVGLELAKEMGLEPPTMWEEVCAEAEAEAEEAAQEPVVEPEEEEEVTPFGSEYEVREAAEKAEEEPVAVVAIKVKRTRNSLHPLAMKLQSLLQERGVATTAELAEAVGEPSRRVLNALLRLERTTALYNHGALRRARWSLIPPTTESTDEN